MRLLIIKRLSLKVLLLLWVASVFAHGGGGSAPDTCPISIGPFNVFFKGYQPETHPKEVFCDNFPSLGSTLLVMDLLQPDLRKSKIKFRAVEVNSILAAQSMEFETAVNPIIDIPAHVYTNGLLSLDYAFEKPGNYAVLMSVEDSTGRHHSGSFTFSVAMPFRNLELYLITSIIIMILMGYLIANVFSKNER